MNMDAHIHILFKYLIEYEYEYIHAYSYKALYEYSYSHVCSQIAPSQRLHFSFQPGSPLPALSS